MNILKLRISNEFNQVIFNQIKIKFDEHGNLFSTNYLIDSLFEDIKKGTIFKNLRDGMRQIKNIDTWLNGRNTL